MAASISVKVGGVRPFQSFRHDAARRIPRLLPASIVRGVCVLFRSSFLFLLSDPPRRNVKINPCDVVEVLGFVLDSLRDLAAFGGLYPVEELSAQAEISTGG